MKLQEKKREVRAILKRILPYAKFAPMTYYPGEGMDPTSATLLISNDNIEFLGSRYFQPTQERSFLHFTKLESLLAIIDSRCFRLNSLAKMTDPREFNFAGKLFYEPHLLVDARENIFSASFCEESLLRKENQIDKFILWRLYGDNGGGVCIVFKFLKDSRDWTDLHLSKILYGIDAKDDLLDLKDTLNRFNKSEPYVHVDCGKFLAFHKSSLYRPEQEIRLIYDSRMKRNFSHTTYSNYGGTTPFPNIVEDKAGMKHLELSLFQKGRISEHDADPQMKIEKIILGYTLKDKFQEKKQLIAEKFEQTLGYTPIVIRSRLERDFWGKEVKNP